MKPILKKILLSFFSLIILSCSITENKIIKISSNFESNEEKFTTLLKISDKVNIDITYPSDKKGDFIKLKSNYPVILFVQGGFVNKERYQWLADHFAEKGFIFVSTEHLFNLPFLQTDNSFLSLNYLINTNNQIIKNLVTKDSKIIIMGHSLGGVVSVYEWLKYDIDALILLASYPDSKSDVKLKSGKPVLSITGSNDKKALPEVVKKGFNSFSSPKVYAEIKGMNHYAWTDNFTQEELKLDGKIDGDLKNIRKNALNIIDTWINAKILNDSNSIKSLNENNFIGANLINE